MSSNKTVNRLSNVAKIIDSFKMPLQKVTMLSQQCPFEGNFPHSSFLWEKYISLCFRFLNTCRVQISTEEGFSREKNRQNIEFKTHMHAHTHTLKTVMRMRELENKMCLQFFIGGSSKCSRLGTPKVLLTIHQIYPNYLWQLSCSLFACSI